MYYLIRTVKEAKYTYWTNNTNGSFGAKFFNSNYQQISRDTRMTHESAVLFKLHLHSSGHGRNGLIIPAMWIPPVGELFIGRNFKL